MKTKNLKITTPVGSRCILVAVDFSKSSLHALQYALALARQHEAQLTLLHVIEPFYASMLMDSTGTQRTAHEAAHPQLAGSWEDTKRAWPRTGLKCGLIDSIAERVVRLAPCPVLVVR